MLAKFYSRLLITANQREFKIAVFKKFKRMASEQPKIGTHSGLFHCDEVLACFMLQQLDEYKNSEIIRSRNYEELNVCDIVVDVGGVFDRETKKFDHHQKTFTETFSSLRPEFGAKYNIKLSSAGLIYVYFGQQIIQNILKNAKGTILEPEQLSKMYLHIYEKFIQEIDAIDNGVPMCDSKPKYTISTSLSSRVGTFNPVWNSTEKLDENALFEKAKQYVGNEFTNIIVNNALTWLPALEIVENAIKNAYNIHDSGEIIELEKPCPWKEHFFNLKDKYDLVLKAKYVLMKNKEEDWRVICVPIESSSFICRKPLHKDWRGLRDEEVASASKIADVTFCHVNGFIGGAKTRQGVLQMAIDSLTGNYTD